MPLARTLASPLTPIPRPSRCQTTRISCKSIGQAASAQVCAVALSIARAKFILRQSGVNVANPLATNSVNLCALAMGDNNVVSDDDFFCITSTSRLVYNSCPVKLSSVSVLSTCIHIARRELDEFYVSNSMCSRTDKFLNICKSLVGEMQLDAVWCAWVLVVYLCSHPRGRDILKDSGLTDVDIQSAVVFERYGGEEIRRRIRQKRALEEQSRKKQRGKSVASSSADPVGDFDDQLGLDGKRKRIPRGPLPSACSDAHGIIEFWHSALQSEDVSVLHTLASHTKRTARDAALSTLAKQAFGTDVGDNVVLRNVSLQNAIKSAKALVSFVGRRVDDIPAIVAFHSEDPKSKKFKMSCGITRIDKEAASSALHACCLPPAALRPSVESGIQVAWSFATKKLIPTTNEAALVPGVLERFREIRNIELEHDTDRVSAKRSRLAATMESYIDVETEMALTQSLTGTTRSFINILTHISINDTHEDAARRLVDETTHLLEQANQHESRVRRYPIPIAKSQSKDTRSEPLSTPASSLAVGICNSEMTRRWMTCKTRKNDTCKVNLGFSSASELSREMPGIMSSEPLPMLTITDVEMECYGEPVFKEGRRLGQVPVSVGVHVCGDGATRLTDVLSNLGTQLENDVDYLKQCRAAIFVAASQASYIGVVSGSLSSGYTNASVASSKKIVTPDVNKLMLLSPYDAYVSGLCNIVRSFDPEPYSGTYSSRVDTGFTMHGLFAHNFRSDKRQHGTLCCFDHGCLNVRLLLALCVCVLHRQLLSFGGSRRRARNCIWRKSLEGLRRPRCKRKRRRACAEILYFGTDSSTRNSTQLHSGRAHGLERLLQLHRNLQRDFGQTRI